MSAYVIKKTNITDQDTPSITDEYTLLNYIQGGGTNGAYIDTGIEAKSNQGFILSMQTTNIENNGYIMGFYGVNNYVWTYRWYIQLTGKKIYVSVTSNGINSLGSQSLDLINLYFNKENNGEYYITNGSKFEKSNNFSNPKHLNWLLFAYTNSDSSKILTPINYKIYSCIFYEDSEIIKNFIPVRNKNNTIGMLDIINNEFYGSANSFAFTGG